LLFAILLNTAWSEWTYYNIDIKTKVKKAINHKIDDFAYLDS